MKQKLLFILIGLLTISYANAQLNVSPGINTRYKASPVKNNEEGQQLRSATAGSLYFGYSGDDISTGVGIGAGLRAELSAAICMPATLSGIYAGKKITKIRIGLDANSTNVSVWIRSSLTGANLVTQHVGSANKGWTEVTLTTPYTIPTGDFYIGYTATGDYQIGFSGKDTYDGCWLYYDKWGEWDNVAGYGFGSLCIQALIDVQGTDIFAVDPETLPKTAQVNQNENFSISNSIKNYSSVDVTSLKIAYQIDGQTPVEKTITTTIAPMKSSYINIPINAIASIGIYQLSVKITEVNGNPNALANNSVNTEIRILSHSFPRKVVMEEGTGTWCPWCIRGIVGMALMKEKYPESFIGIAVHNGDPMTVPAYDNYMGQFFPYYPSAVTNRKKELIGDPHPDYGAEYYYSLELAQKPIASIQLTGGFVDSNKKSITLKTVTTFGVSADNTNFKLAYVLVENGVTGYSQANGYAGGGSGEMGGYEKKPATITDMVFDDVARGIYSEPTGIAGSIPGSIKELEPVEHTYTINLPSTIQNADKLEVVVMLLHANSGEIENADMVKISGYTGLQTIASGGISVSVNSGRLFVNSADPVQGIEIYTVSGQKVISQTSNNNTVPVNHLVSGVYIVKVKTSAGEKVFKVII